jgi:hypothetical protein
MTLKQKLVASKIVENRGNVSRSMREAGYSPNTAKNPKNLTKSKTWGDLMKDYFPDDGLATIHKQILNATDTTASLKALDMAYKLKGYYKVEKSQDEPITIKVINYKQVKKLTPAS